MFLVLSTVVSQSVRYNKKAVLMNDWLFEIIYPAKSKKGVMIALSQL